MEQEGVEPELLPILQVDGGAQEDPDIEMRAPGSVVGAAAGGEIQEEEKRELGREQE